jgi:tetratricopeptide (TPR) repeat protein
MARAAQTPVASSATTTDWTTPPLGGVAQDDQLLEVLELPLNGPRRFWLGFVFVDDARAAARAAKLTEALVQGRARELERQTASAPPDIAVTARRVLRHTATDSTVWLDWSALGRSADDRRALEDALALLNAGRTKLVKALHGGLVVAAPSWSEELLANGAVDLWSGREFALRLPSLRVRDGAVIRPHMEPDSPGPDSPEPESLLWRRLAPIAVLRALRESGPDGALEVADALAESAAATERARLETVAAGVALQAGHPEAALARSTAVVESEPAEPGVLAAAAQISAVASSDWAAAVGLWSAALDVIERDLGPDHPDALTSRNNLANAYYTAGDLVRAIPLHEATLADSERILGPDHPDALTSRNNLANAYETAGDLARAIPIYEATLADRERILGPDHPDTLTSRNNLAYAYQTAGDLARAIPIYEATLSDSERILGPDHPDTLTSRNNLAYAYQTAGAVARAIPLYEATLTGSDRVLGTDHPSTLMFRGNLAAAYESAGDVNRALPLYERVLADSERILGPDHPLTRARRESWERARTAQANDRR